MQPDDDDSLPSFQDVPKLSTPDTEASPMIAIVTQLGIIWILLIEVKCIWVLNNRNVPEIHYRMEAHQRAEGSETASIVVNAFMHRTSLPHQHFTSFDFQTIT